MKFSQWHFTIQLFFSSILFFYLTCNVIYSIMIIEREETKTMRLVCEGKYRINQLGYNKKTHEYVYFHKGKEIWREKGDESLLNYFDEIRAKDTYTEQSVLNQYPIYLKYSDSCHKFELEEMKKWFK